MPTFQFFNLLQGEEGITLDVEGLHSKGVLAVRVDVDVLIDPPSVRVQGGGPRRLCKVETLSFRQTKTLNLSPIVTWPVVTSFTLVWKCWTNPPLKPGSH